MDQGNVGTRLVGGVLAAAAAALLCLPAAAQNAVPNPDFDTNDVSAWDLYPDLTVQWAAGPVDDAFGSPSSGSARVVNSAAGALNSGPSTCLATPVTGGAPYDFGATIRVPTGQPATGQAFVYVYWWGVAGCGSLVDVSATAAVAADGAWHLSTLTNVVAPPTAQSVSVILQVYKNVAGGTFEAYFDRVFFGPPGTTPVSLQGFSAE